MLSSGFKKNTPQGIHLPSGSEHGAGQAFWFSGLILHCGGLGETPSEQRPCPPKPHTSRCLPQLHTQPFLPPWLWSHPGSSHTTGCSMLFQVLWALTQFGTSPACTGVTSGRFLVPSSAWRGLPSGRRGSPSPTALSLIHCSRCGQVSPHPAGGRPPALWGHTGPPLRVGCPPPKRLPSRPLKSFHALPLDPESIEPSRCPPASLRSSGVSRARRVLSIPGGWGVPAPSPPLTRHPAAASFDLSGTHEAAGRWVSSRTV